MKEWIEETIHKTFAVITNTENGTETFILKRKTHKSKQDTIQDILYRLSKKGYYAQYDMRAFFVPVIMADVISRFGFNDKIKWAILSNDENSSIISSNGMCWDKRRFEIVFTDEYTYIKDCSKTRNLLKRFYQVFKNNDVIVFEYEKYNTKEDVINHIIYILCTIVMSSFDIAFYIDYQSGGKNVWTA